MAVNTAALKTFAPAMRRQLMEAVGRKLDLLLNSQTPDTLSTNAKQIAELRLEQEKSREQVLERVAYTWFNRLCALRYLDAKGWHPFGCKVLMPADASETQPELLKLMRSGSLPADLKAFTNEARLNQLLDGQIPTAIPGGDAQGEVYRELVLAACRSYHQLLPDLFEGLDDASELLLPDDLLTEGSIAGSFRSSISDSDCEDVEIIGWLYQFYISEKKDEVIGKVVKSDDIPAATQLFTPNWIVKYMVQNSLGAQWLATYPNSPLKETMEYYIEPAEQTAEVKAQLASITPSQLNPEELTLIDPASGSGHILVEAYELFKAIYLERGYRQRDVPELILTQNLFGLDIDERAAQLTGFALMMKGRADDRRLFERGVKLNVMALVDSASFDAEALAKGVELSDYGLQPGDLTELKRLFEHATTFGSLIQVPEGLASSLPALKQLSEATSQELFVSEAIRRLEPVVQQAELLAAQYDAVVANPPYMGTRTMPRMLNAWCKKHYSGSCADLFSCFIDRLWGFTSASGFLSLVTLQNWMFLPSFEELRYRLIREATIRTLVQIGFNTFPELNSKVSLGCVFSISPASLAKYVSTYVNCNSAPKSADKHQVFLGRSQATTHFCDAAKFHRVPGHPIAYWASDDVMALFDNEDSMSKVSVAKQGMATTDNEYYLRNWTELPDSSIAFPCTSRSDKSWFPFNKGGGFRRWYGLGSYVVRYTNDGAELLELVRNKYPRISDPEFVIKNRSFYFKEGITWTAVSLEVSARYIPSGYIFATIGPMAFFSDARSLRLGLAFVNSNLSAEYRRILNPSLMFNLGDYENLPYPATALKKWEESSVTRCIEVSRTDWNAYERSWDFQSLPLLTASSEPTPTPTLESSYIAWITQNKGTIAEMKRLEEENNRLFIDAYGLADELTPDVPIEEITLTVNPAYRYSGKLTEDEQWTRFRQDTMEELVSYAIGCMMGRYSLDAPGLIYAHSGNEGFDPSKYLRYPADIDGILPVLDGEWFEDDVPSRLREFLLAAFPESSVLDNLRFIEQGLGKTIRKYICSDFYKSHLQSYKKRPIYWMVQSPKGGFACLIYLHRYTRDTLNLVLNNYFRPYLQKLEARSAQLEQDQLNESLPKREQTAARKEVEKITKVLKECQAWEQDALLPLAQQRIELDLDDGVKVNYLKLQEVLAKIPGLAAKED